MNIEIIRSNRKSVSIEIKPDLRIIVRAPLFMKKADIEHFIEEKDDWIKKNLEKVKAYTEKNRVSQPPFSDNEIKALTDKAKKIIPGIVDFYANILGVKYGKITIRHQTSRWGSCSSKGNLNFNCALILCDSGVIDYVVVHELCHLKEMNHSPDFWAEVEKVFPDYKKHKKWLKENGTAIISRIK